MSKDKDKDELWLQARIQWESEPLATFAAVSKPLGVSKQAVAARAKKDGWVKRLDMGTITSRAHALADKAIQQDSDAQSKEPTQVVAKPSVFSESPTASSDANPETMQRVAEDKAVDARAELIARHRKETTNARVVLYGAIKSKDLTEARTAKAVIEGMKLLQETERKAWGIESAGENDKAVVIIERGGRNAS